MTLEDKDHAINIMKVVGLKRPPFFILYIMRKYSALLLFTLVIHGISLAQEKFDVIPLEDGLFMHRTIGDASSQNQTFNGLLIDAQTGYILVNPARYLLHSKKIEAWIKATDEKPILMVILTRPDTSLMASADYFIEAGAIVSTNAVIAGQCEDKMKYAPSGHLSDGSYSIGDLNFELYSGKDNSLLMWVEKYHLLYGSVSKSLIETDNDKLSQKLEFASKIIPFRGKPSF
jgi:hypothetical protein